MDEFVEGHHVRRQNEVADHLHEMKKERNTLRFPIDNQEGVTCARLSVYTVVKRTPE